jgi:DTW domain-containing protein YfiP
MAALDSFSPRAACARCLRPTAMCWCAHLTQLDTRTRVVLLQHPRERTVAIGTARMASLCLPNSELHVGVDWSGSAALARALSDPARPAALLYPGEGSVDVVAHPPSGPITLVVVDGTWSHTRKLVRLNPALAALPRYSFTPPAPSEYRIRREPKETFVSTLEALVHVLGAIEGEPQRFRAMLAPFRAMIDAQIACEAERQHHRGRGPRPPKPPRPRLSTPLAGRETDVVCVIGEANAWPRGVDRSPAPFPQELVQWIAHRPSTGETFEAIVRPQRPVSPAIESQIGLRADEVLGGEALGDALARWRAFVRETDVVCAWGDYGTGLFDEVGGYVPGVVFDVRRHARTEANSNVGGPLEYLAKLGGAEDDTTPCGRGRAGVRLGQIVAIARRLAAMG